MAIIRRAEVGDTEAAIEQGKRFAQVAHPEMEYCADSMRVLMEQLITDGTLLVAEKEGAIVGGIGGIAAPYFHNRNYKMLIEQFWWVHQEERGSLGIRLLTAFEARAKEIGCTDVYMIALEHVDVQRVERIYLKLGYRAAERGYRKRI